MQRKFQFLLIFSVLWIMPFLAFSYLDVPKNASANSELSEKANVKMVDSNGNKEFQQSVVDVVRRAASFPELANLNDDDFNQYFKKFEFIFRAN